MTSNSQQQASLDNFRPLLKERGELHVLKKQIEDKIKQLDEDLRPVLEGRGEIVAEGYSFNCKLTAGRKTLDKDALAAVLKERGYAIEDFEKQGAPFTTMTIKPVNVL